MQSQLNVTWRRMDASSFLEERIKREVAALERRFGRITACSVVIEGPGPHTRHGGHYAIRITLELPDRSRLVASRNPAAAAEHADAYVAVRDTFRAMRRQLREHADQIRDGAPRADDRLHGVIARIGDGYGFITADDGREIYFHENALIEDGFDTLRPGAEVRFSEAEGENGPQATSVRAFGPGSGRSKPMSPVITEKPS